MIDLLKTDLKRAVKDKLFIVICIIAGAFAIITPLLYKVIFVVLEFDEEAMQELEMLGMGIMNAKSIFFSSFSLGNNFGLILPIFVAIILCKDFSNGTIRNKIICGKSRTSIYFSLFFTCAILICSFILMHALLTLLLSLLVFDYQSTPFTASDFGYLMGSIALEILVYLFVCALLTFFIVCMKNAGLSIVMFFIISFLMIIIGGITQAMVLFADPATTSYKILEIFNSANVFTTSIIGNGTSYKLNEILYLVLPNVCIMAILIVLGLSIFKKKDLK